MSLNSNNFNTNKLKFSNMYTFEGYKSNHYLEKIKSKTSCSPKRMFGLKEFNKTIKNNTILPMMKSYNIQDFKLGDIVKSNL